MLSRTRTTHSPPEIDATKKGIDYFYLYTTMLFSSISNGHTLVKNTCFQRQTEKAKSLYQREK